MELNDLIFQAIGEIADLDLVIVNAYYEANNSLENHYRDVVAKCIIKQILVKDPAREYL